VKISNFQGRAVFLDKNNTSTNSLALIDLNILKFYDNFSSSSADKVPSYWFDLSLLSSTGEVLRESVVNDWSYIKTAPWMSTGKDGADNEMRRLMTYSRHIRNNVLVTPFTNGGTVRVWSMIDNGVRLTSFPVDEQEHVMAFSKDYKYAASYIQGTRSVFDTEGSTLTINTYNVKIGLLVNKLKSRRQEELASSFEVSHIRFCYEARYLGMAGVETTVEKNGNKMTRVVFEVWYIEPEQSIFYKSEIIYPKDADYKSFSPFVTQSYTNNENGNVKNCCLVGFYTTANNSNFHVNGRAIINRSMVLDIDEEAHGNSIEPKWIGTTEISSFEALKEIENNLGDYTGLKCGTFKIGEQTYLIRFGKYMVQLWLADQQNTKKEMISKEDELIYIRAYKGPNYGLDYSFRDNWIIHSSASIKFIKEHLLEE
jgi:hypothetical protein